MKPGNLASVLASAPLLWLALAAPGLVLLVNYASGAMSYGEFIRWSGDIAVWLLIAMLSFSPLRRIARGNFRLWLGKRRRSFGVAVFGYAAGHLAAYLLLKADPDVIWQEGVEAGLLTGWIAFAIFLALALTSNDTSVQMLRGAWKRLHWFIYPAAVLAAAHWILTAADPIVAVVHAVAIALLLVMRFVPEKRKA
ncbi:MAG TPA: ferric reductase-like transmembrane domain-containing protein [Hyphomonadaceae bacterium]|jgi:sulfoxide reductase heme-binding subunit YedZ|nr:ferric reductase-like transmembrane domain-containing protein [Hyphomonadaceae bacterium]